MRADWLDTPAGSLEQAGWLLTLPPSPPLPLAPLPQASRRGGCARCLRLPPSRRAAAAPSSSSLMRWVLGWGGVVFPFKMAPLSL